MISHTEVIGLRIPRPVEPEQHVGKIRDPADEKRHHQPMHIDDEAIDILAMFRSEDRHLQNFRGALPQRVKKISHSQLFGVFSDSGLIATSGEFAAAAFFPIKTKKVAMLPSTMATTPSRL